MPTTLPDNPNYLPETPEWEDAIYQIETDDPVVGGPDGICNIHARQLANRTAFLKALAEGTSGALAAHEAGTNHPAATTAAQGMVRLSTVAEALAGLLADAAVTPQGLAAAIAALVDSSPATLDTLQELAAALGDDPNFAATVTNLLATKAPLESPALTGTPTAPTAAAGTGTDQLATTAFVAAALAGLAVPDSSIGKHTVAIPATAMDPTITGGCGYYSRVEVAAGQPEVAYLPFDAVTEESAEFRVAVPKSWDGGTITFKAIWSHAGGTQFGVSWGVKAAFLGNDDAHALAFGAEVAVTDVGGTVNDVYVTAESAAITPSGTPANDGLLIVRVSRKVADAGDTLDVDARLEAVQIMWTTDASTDA